MKITHVLRSEVVKAATLPSLCISVITTVLIALAFCLVDASPDIGLSTPQSVGVYAMANFSFFVVITGVLIASSEYSGGQITSTVLAVPRRGRLLVAKLVVSAAISTSQGLLFALFIASIYQARLGGRSVFATGTANVLLSSLTLAVCSWTALGILSTCTAIVLRSPTIALASLIVLSFGGTPLMMAIPAFQYLPTNAGVLMFIDRATQTADWANPPSLSIPAAAITVVAWCIVAGVAAATVLQRRDIGSRQASFR